MAQIIFIVTFVRYFLNKIGGSSQFQRPLFFLFFYYFFFPNIEYISKDYFDNRNKERKEFFFFLNKERK